VLKRKRTSLPTEPVELVDPFSEEPPADLSQEPAVLVTVMGQPRADQEPMLVPESQTTPFKRDRARENWFHTPRQEAVAHPQSSRARSALHREIRDLAYTGSRPLLGELFADLRRRLPPPKDSPRTWMRKGLPTTSPSEKSPKPPIRPPPQRRLRPQEVSWWSMLPA
jgi:hypothetical protein